MQFEWDKIKANNNVIKHKVTFDEAITVFYDPLSVTFIDSDHSLDEVRFIIIGYSSRNRLLVVSHTDRGKTIRIISSRTATADERKRHEI